MKPEKLSEYAGKRVLVLGASGFIGTKLTQALEALGANIFAGSRSQCDVTAPAQLSATFDQAQPEIIFNLTMAPRGNGDIADYRTQFAVTFGGTTNIAQLMIARHPQALLVQVGSSEEYGRSSTPFHENQGDDPVSAYSVAKCAATRFLITAAGNLNLNAIVARPTVVYGPGQCGAMFIPSLMSAYTDKRVPDLTPGEQTRDFIYIDDLIAGLLVLGLNRRLSGEIFNLCSGVASPLKTVARVVADLCQYEGELGLGRRSYRRHEVMEHCASFAKVHAAVGWSPEITIEEGLRRTVNWWQTRTKAPVQ
jgi:nucleoside-diphosphate-sugar epimerase